MSSTHGFTAIEALVTLGILAVTAGISVPLYHTYQLRSDLDIAVEQARQGLQRAQVLARAGQNDAVWGYAAAQGTVFQGDAYAVREPSADEAFILPPTVAVTGLTEVTFERVTGEPRSSGDVVYIAGNGERRIVTVEEGGAIAVTELLPPASSSDAAESSSPVFSSAGASQGQQSSTAASLPGGTSSQGTGGSSGGTAGSSGTAASNGGANAASSEGMSSSAATCQDAFTILPDGTVVTTGSADATVKVLGTQVSEGAGGASAKVTVSASTDGGETWTPLFQGKNIKGGEQEILRNLPAGTHLSLKVNGRHSWLFNRTYVSNNADGHMLVLRNGGVLPVSTFDSFGNPTGLAAFLRSLITGGKIAVAPRSAVFLTELDALWKNSSKFQDAVVQVDFALADGSCGVSGDPKMKISFDRLENEGAGDAARGVFVGQGIRYAEGQWIPLAAGGVTLTDSSLLEDVPGMAVERRTAGVVRVLLHGSHTLPAGKEIADARIVFEHARVTAVENDTGQNATENPFDGVVNDGPDGDEVTVASDHGSVLYQTRVTTNDDAILIHWQLGEPATSSSSSQAGTPASSSAESSGWSSSSAGSIDLCAPSFTQDGQGRVVLGEPADVTFSVLGSRATYGQSGPLIRVRLNASIDGGATWKGLFGFRDILAGDTETLRDIPAGAVLSLSAEGRYSWLFKRSAKMEDHGGRIRLLKSGDAFPVAGLLRTPAELQTFLRDRMENGKALLGGRQLLAIAELQDLDDTTDFQDAVVLLSLLKSSNRSACGGGSEGGTSSSSFSASSGQGGETSSSSSITGPKVTVCHVPSEDRQHAGTIQIAEAAWPAHEAHGDRRGACAGDDDGDGIANADDFCPGTYMPEAVPTEYMLFTRYALAGTTGIFREGPRKKVSAFTLADTRGCSCEQLVDVAEDVRTYYFDQEPLLLRELRSLFPFYTTGARQYGCGAAILRMSRP